MSWLAARTSRPASHPTASVKRPSGPTGFNEGRAVLASDLAVDLTEGRRQVDQARPLLRRHVRSRDDPPPVGAMRWVHVVKGTLVAKPDQGRTGHTSGHPGGRPLPHDGVDQRVGHHDPVDDGVDQLRVHRDARVRQQRPRRRRPDAEPLGPTAHRRGNSTVGVDQPEAHVGRLVLLVPVDVGLPQLVARQRRPAARAVRHDLQILVEQALVEELLQVPPDGLDVGRVQRPVGRVHVDPVADARRQAGELVHVGIDGLAAEPGELGDADLRLDLLLPRDAELLLHFDLDRQPVGVPAGAASHVGAVHRAEAAEEVLVDPGPDVVQAGHAVCRRRALVEDPGLGVLALLDGALEDALRRPAGQFGLLEGDEVDVGGDGCEHGREWPLCGGNRRPGHVGKDRGYASPLFRHCGGLTLAREPYAGAGPRWVVAQAEAELVARYGFLARERAGPHGGHVRPAGRGLRGGPPR